MTVVKLPRKPGGQDRWSAFENFIYKHCTQQRYVGIDELCRRARSEGLAKSGPEFCDLFNDWIREHNSRQGFQIKGLFLDSFNSGDQRAKVMTPEGHQLHYFKLTPPRRNG